MLDALVDTLLYEGYALYPYTPGATKNATPTPFGIVYPPAYAAGERRDVRPRCRSSACADGAAVSRRGALPPGQRGPPRGRRRAASTSRRPGGAVGVRLRRPARPRLARASPAARMTIRVENHTEVARRASTARRRCGTPCSPPTSSGASRGGRFVSPLEAQGCEQINSWPVLATRGRRRRARRRDHAPRPPADRAREQGQPVRLDRDRGGAADPRARALRRRARGGRRAGPGGAADARARGADDAAGADGPARPRARSRTRARASRRPRSTASPTGAATRSCCGRPATRRRRTTSSRAAGRRSSGSTSTTTAPCTSPSPSTTSPARTSCATSAATCTSRPSEVEVA